MKLFSLSKANALIPVLEPLLDELLTKRRELAIRLLESDPGIRPPSTSGTSVSSPTRRIEARRNTELKAEVIRLMGKIEAHGCVLKDVTLGLVDFPALRGGTPVFLCWKMGEPEVAHWHSADETFVDRKPL